MGKVALITGIGGQDGSYLAEFLLGLGYAVHGTIRPSSVPNDWRIAGIRDRITLHNFDIAADPTSLIDRIAPDEIYHLAAEAHVPTSFELPVHVANVIGLGTARFLEAIRHVNPRIRFYQASTSELFGQQAAPQSETTPMIPTSPYGIAKLYAFHMTRMYREAYGIFASNGILFNHESPRRSERFLSRKVALAVARIKAGLQGELRVGDLSAERDWGWAPEYVEAMHRILQHDSPGDFVIGTGESHSASTLVNLAFRIADLDPEKYVVRDESLIRPIDNRVLRADITKAQRELGWQPKVGITGIMVKMVEAELNVIGSVNKHANVASRVK